MERRYEVLEALGTGGFGTVYRARYQGEGGFSQMVALKILNPEMAKIDEVASRLRDEARVLGLVRHRAIVQVHRLVQFNDNWSVVMELVEGADLSLVLKSGVIIPVGPVLEIIAEVAAALHVAWTTPGPDGRPLHLLHRDIKPSNIQITSVGEVKVLDFGIARADFDEREAMTKKLAFGSTEYMAPERLDLMDGPAADIYSLGSVAYELITRSPFGRTSATRERHEPKLRKNLSKLREELPPWQEPVAELIADMLAWDPSERPDARTVERRALTLRGQIEGEPLRFWAEDHIPRAMALRQAVSGSNHTGSILIERREGQTSAEPIAEPAGADPVLEAGPVPRVEERPAVPPAFAPAPLPPDAESEEQDPAAQLAVTRHASDPTDAPSVAFLIGPQAKAPRQLHVLAPPTDEELATRREDRPRDDDATQAARGVGGVLDAAPHAQAESTLDLPPIEPPSAVELAPMDGEALAPPAGEPPPGGETDDPPTAPPLADPAAAPDEAEAPTTAMPPPAAPPVARPRALSPVLRAPPAPRPMAPPPGLPEAFASLPVPAPSGETTDPILDLDPPTEESPDLGETGPPAARPRRPRWPLALAALLLPLLVWALWPSPPAPDGATPTDVGATLGPDDPAAPSASGPPDPPNTASPAAGAARPTPSKAETPKTEAPKTEAPKTEAPKTEAPKTEAPKTEAPKTETPKTEPPKAEPAKAHVTVTGDVSRVGLKGSSGLIQVSSGEVPPGTYEIYVRFEGREDQAAGRAGTVSLAPGERVTLVCDQAFAECRRR